MNVSFRYALSLIFKPQNKKISFPALLSVFGVCFGISAYIIVSVIFESFQEKIKSAIYKANPDIIVYSASGISNPDDVLKNFQKLLTEPIEAKSYFIYYEGIISYKGKISTAYIRSIEGSKSTHSEELKELIIPYDGLRTLDFRKITSQSRDDFSSFSNENMPNIILGKLLAENIGAKQGDTIKLIYFKPKNKKGESSTSFIKLNVSGVISFGISQYDKHYALMNFHDGKKLFSSKGNVTGIELRFYNKYSALSQAKILEQNTPYSISSWEKIDYQLFQQIQRDKIAIKLIVLIIVLVGAFNITVSLGLNVLDRRREIAILKSLGAQNNVIIRGFIYYGIILGFVGYIIGIIVTVFVLYLLSGVNIENLRDLYFISKIPVKINFSVYFYSLLFTLALSIICSILPAWWASKVLPIEHLKRNR